MKLRFAVALLGISFAGTLIFSAIADTWTAGNALIVCTPAQNNGSNCLTDAGAKPVLLGTAAAGSIDISNGSNGSGGALRIGADAAATTRTDSTTKSGVIVAYPYANSDLPLEIVYERVTSSVNVVAIGGGSGGSSMHAATAVDLCTGATNTTASNSATCAQEIDAAKHLTFKGTAPSATSNGTAASCVGGDIAFRCTVGASPNAALVMTFASVFTTNAPVCRATDETSGKDMPVTSVSVSGVSFTSPSTLTASDKISGSCFGIR